MTKVFETRVVSIGEQAPTMLEEANMLILFGLEAPADLAEYCYQISNKDLLGSIQLGAYLVIDSIRYTITAVGNIVEQNLATLGHITIAFDSSEEPSLPGTLHVEHKSVPTIHKGSIIEIITME